MGGSGREAKGQNGARRPGWGRRRGLRELCGKTAGVSGVGFSRGRGIAHAIGVMLVLSRPALAAFIIISLLGVKLQSIPIFTGLGILAAPVTAKAAGQPREITRGLAVMATVIAAKRLLGNAPPDGIHGRLPSVLLRRLLFDRDTPERDAWVRQRLDD